MACRLPTPHSHRLPLAVNRDRQPPSPLWAIDGPPLQASFAPQRARSLPAARRRRSAAVRASGWAHGEERWRGEGRQADLALLVDVEGVMVDLHRNGHMESLNAALSSLAFDAHRLSTSRYRDLHRKCAGNLELLLSTHFDATAWPIPSLDAQGKQALVQRLLHLKSQELSRAVQQGSVPLRPGLVEFLQAAVTDGVHVAVLAGLARSGEETARALVQGMPAALQRQVRVVGEEDARESAFGQVALGGGASAGVDEALAAQIAQAVLAEKLRIAEEVARTLKLTVDLDTPSESQWGIAMLRAAAEVVGVPVVRCVVLAGCQATVQLGGRAGMTTCVIRSSMTSGAEFRGVRAVFDGFGPGALTLPRLLRMLAAAPAGPLPPL
ncbi:hypothetical protein CLOM_g14595 [Closterium sp. NIES-68]|nr:hypothetical protein CLOM_g14595 [Closterium sp. NIES-68]GJP82438.1 hypothetical protein CLOP_g12697 [Closterium sp. NIES-67]